MNGSQGAAGQSSGMERIRVTNSPLLCFAAPWLPAWVFSRIFIAIFVYLGHLSHPYLEKIAGGYAGVANWWLNPWTTFDSLHFLSIAGRGYTAKTTAFFPLYPLILRPLGPDEVRMALAGVLISDLAFVGALWIFWHLTRETYGEKVARRGVWLLAFFPVGAFSMAVYSESLFLVLALGAFWCARHQKWVFAGVLAALAALTRNYGPVLSLALAFEWQRSREKEKASAGRSFSTSAAPFLAIVAPLGAFLGVQLFAARFGGALAGVASQGNYFRAPTFPLVPLWRDGIGILSGAQFDIVTLLNFGVTLLAFWLMWRARKIAPRADLVLLGGVLLMHLTLARTIPPYTNGSLRYLLTLWPFTQLLARECEVFALNQLRMAAFCAIYGLLCAVSSYLFGLKSFLG